MKYTTEELKKIMEIGTDKLLFDLAADLIAEREKNDRLREALDRIQASIESRINASVSGDVVLKIDRETAIKWNEEARAALALTDEKNGGKVK